MGTKANAEAASSSTPATGFRTERMELTSKQELEKPDSGIATTEETPTRITDQPDSPPITPPSDPPSDGHRLNQISIGTLSRATLQPKLKIGLPNDKYEREADQVAEKIVRMPELKSLVTQRTARLPKLNYVRPQHFTNKAKSRSPVESELPIQRKTTVGRTPQVTKALTSQLSSKKDKGQALPKQTQMRMESGFGRDFSQVQVHTDDEAAQMNLELQSKAFTYGQNIFFGKGKFAPESVDGKRLLAHELTHVVQQSGSEPQQNQARPGIIYRDSDNDSNEFQIDEEHVPEDSGIPDDDILTAGIRWPKAQELNLEWWQTLNLISVLPIRNYDPIHQPKAWSNKVFAAQIIIRDSGISHVENRRLIVDGVLGPRTILALKQVAQDETNTGRTSLQTLGFNLASLAIAEDAANTALATMRPATFLLEWNFAPLGEHVIRYYDLNYTMALEDQRHLDELFFGGNAPESIRREDRIELLRRAFGTEGQSLQGRIAFIYVNRPSLSDLDLRRAVDRDPNTPEGKVLQFYATTLSRSSFLLELFEQQDALASAVGRVSARNRRAIDAVAELLKPVEDGEPQREERAAFIYLVYLPVLPEEVRTTLVDNYLVEKSEQARQQQEARQTQNREAAKARADELVRLMSDEEIHQPLRGVYIQSFLRRQLSSRQHFDLVIDNLVSRPTNQFIRLFDVLESLNAGGAQLVLLELCLAGRYASHARVRSLMAQLNERRTDRQDHRYVAGNDPHVILNAGQSLSRDIRLDIGQVAGDRSDIYYRDETKERLKPASEQRLSAELENQVRIYFANLANGQEPERSTDEIGQELMQRAWRAANMSADKDIEEIEIRESFRLLGVREAAAQDDGLQRWDVEYQKVTRIIGDDSDTGWVDDATTRAWQSDSNFELDLFWLSFSQNADVIQAAAKTVAVGAVLIVAWEAGAIAALVRAGGGVVQVLASIAISEAIYMLTHERWTLQGLLVAGIQGYLGALGFRAFAPVGAAIAGRIGTETYRQLVVRWFVRHGTTGALSGVVTGPAGVFAEDIIRIAQNGGGRLSGLNRYVLTAAIGLLIGAAAEIAGSAILTPIFRTADNTALGSLDEVLTPSVKQTISPTQWAASLAGVLSKMRSWSKGVMDDSIANSFIGAMRQRFDDAILHYRTGWSLMIHRQVLEMTSKPLTRASVDGLERLLRSTQGHLDNEAMLGLLNHAARQPAHIPAWLGFIGGLDDNLVRRLATGGKLQQLADSPATLALVTRRSPGEVAGLLSQRFGNTVEALESFSASLNQLDDAVADQVLTLLRTHGSSVTPNVLLRIAHTGIPLDGDEISGLARLFSSSPSANAADLEQLLLTMPNNRLRDFLSTAHSAQPNELVRLRSLSANPQQGQRLLIFADNVAEAIRILQTVDASILAELHLFLENAAWRRNAERNLMNLLLNSPTSVDAARAARLAMSHHDLPGIESWTVRAGRQARNPDQLRDLELSLVDAATHRAGDPTVAVEVDFYNGVPQTHSAMNALRNTPGFDKKRHANMDVVTATQFREFKRANDPIANNRQFRRRLGTGAGDFAKLGLDRQALGGAREHVLFIDFNTQLDTSFRTATWLQGRVIDYASRNPDFRRTVDTLIIRYIDASSVSQTLSITIPLP